MTTIRSLFSRQSIALFLGLYAFRVLNAFLVDTYFSADEFYQSVEVAHYHVFDHHASSCPGGKNDTISSDLTWEWQVGLRGYLHPMIFTILFHVMRHWLHIINAEWYVWAPRVIVQSVSSAVCDWTVYQLSIKWFAGNRGVAGFALFTSLTNWFHWYCGVRTFSNSMETSAVMLCLLYYPYYPMSFTPLHAVYDSHWWLFFAGLSVVLRPTCAIIFLPLYFIQLIDVGRRLGVRYSLRFFVVKTIPHVVFWVVGSVALDTYMYGRLVIVVWEFLKFNIIDNRSHLYGVQPWHWYFSQGFPVICFTHLIFLVVYLVRYRNERVENVRQALNLPLILVVYVLVFYSLMAHKEFRFVYPVLPIIFIYVGKCHYHLLKSKKWRTTIRFVLLISVILQGLMIVYFSKFHQRGTIAAMAKLRTRVSSVDTVYFMMPCHHAPSYSYLYNYNGTVDHNVCLKHLDCSPYFGPHPETYEEEQDVFYRDPEAFLHTKFQDYGTLPSHIVMYEDLKPKVSTFLVVNNYREIDKVFHMIHPHVHDRRMSEHILIFERQQPL